MARMQGAAALVTGAGSGIGRATALRFAVEGARVACFDRAAGAADATAAAIKGAGGEAFGLDGDVTDEAACARMVAATVERFGGLTTLVNSAGVGPQRELTPAEEFRQIVAINLTGTWQVSQAARAALAASGRGSVTNLASIYGLVGSSRSPGYAGSKGGVVNLTRQLAAEWAPAIRVNCVCPGHIDTPLTAGLMADAAWRDQMLARYPLRRFGRVDDVAAAILYLASEEASFVTGAGLAVDGGYTAV